MADHQRLDDLRRRIEKDPASIAFAQLAEECRRAGHLEEAISRCRAGLAVHPGFVSARVTLGRALLEAGQLDDAQREMEFVLKSSPGSLAASRGLAQIHHQRGDLAEALKWYRKALSLAPNDPELDETVRELTPEAERSGRALHEATGGAAGASRPAVAPETSGAAPKPDPMAGAERSADWTVARLEQFLAAIHVARAERRA